MDEQSLGKIAYDAYLAVEPAGRSSISNDELPDWDGQSPGIRRRWNAAASAVRRTVLDALHSDG